MRTSAHGRFGGPEGNEALTGATGLLLALLLAAEGVTIIDLGGLRTPHMFIGVLLLGPVVVKLSSTGWRFARYYLGARAYRDKGPPQLALRVLAPLLVAATLLVFATGVILLVEGRRSGLVLELHKVSFIVWGAIFAVHFLAYLPRTVRSVRSDWTADRRREVAGAGLRLWLILGSLAAGLVAALALLSLMTGWNSQQT